MVFSTESRCLIDKATTQERRETKPSATKQIQNTIVAHAMHVRFHVVMFITLLLFIFGRSCQNNKKK